MNLTSASIVVISGRLLGRTFDFITMLVLARLLVPQDFGLVALAMVAVTVAEGVTELPIGQVLLREAAPTRAMYSTAFTLALIRSGVLFVALTLAGFGMEALMGDPRLVSLVAALSIAPALRGLVSPRLTEFSRKLDFRRDMVSDICGKAAALVVAVTVAADTRSYWAIAAATITSPVVQNILSYMFAPFRPTLGLAEWHRFSYFLKWGSMTQILNVANWQAARFILGLVRTTDAVGRFSFTADICSLPYKVFVEPLGRPIYARFAQDRHSGLDLSKTYLRYSAFMVIIGAPIYIFLAIMSEPLIRVLLGERWLSISSLVTVVALLSIIGLPTFPLGSWALTIGRARVLTLRSATEFVILIPIQIAGASYAGIEGILAAQCLGGLVMLLVNMSAARTFGSSYWAQISAIHRPLMAIGVMAIVLLALRPLLAEGTLVIEVVQLGAIGMIAGLVYALALYALWRFQGSPNGPESALVEIVSRVIR